MSIVDAERQIEAVAEGLAGQVAELLGISPEDADKLIERVGHLYMDRMKDRFTDLRFNNRLKRTNPFLLQVRGARTVRQWAENQVMSALFASEEEAIGHVLETIAKVCHPTAREPLITDDLDFEVEDGDRVTGYQIKMSWDCMPMSSRKNLSNTVRNLREHYQKQGKEFVGVFAPCYGRSATNKTNSQEYVSMRSREFWTDVGNGDQEYDIKVGEVCRLLCSEFRSELSEEVVPELIDRLTAEGVAVFGTPEGDIDFRKLFRKINP
ncbi:PmeII family type II restriction endonuclease [Magnetospirillum aberrantis]|uniref:Type II restriction endonuclease EcoO109IR domain-containing protein n=1 Tax=Magnetospirillum aberrantis SpK TaxID=908842 RepID=A0A7C9UYV1_9PROT|nr:PmeII family type II restriction endonuclease [Magnetospirillum aberrantis]NFV79854.1 hypothetical protein [Magnetospirillum aberrantis SpK]